MATHGVVDREATDCRKCGGASALDGLHGLCMGCYFDRHRAWADRLAAAVRASSVTISEFGLAMGRVRMGAPIPPAAVRPTQLGRPHALPRGNCPHERCNSLNPRHARHCRGCGRQLLPPEPLPPPGPTIDLVETGMAPFTSFEWIVCALIVLVFGGMIVAGLLWK